MAKKGLKGISAEELDKWEALLKEDPDIAQMDEQGNVVDMEPGETAPPVEEPPVAEEPVERGGFGKGGPNYKGREWALSLEELHGDNPDDWRMIYDFSRDYILGHWQGIIRNKTGRNDYFVKDTAENNRQDIENFVDMAFARLVLRAPAFRTLQEARGWVAQAAATEWWDAVRKERGTASADKQVGEGGGSILDAFDLDSLSSGKFVGPEDIDAADEYISGIRRGGNKEAVELLDAALKELDGQQLSPALIRSTVATILKGDSTLGDWQQLKRGRQAARES